MRGLMIKKSALAFLLISITACSSPNIPSSFRFHHVQDRPAVAQLFFDANGTIYPDDWQKRLGEARMKKTKSILNGATPEERTWISEQETNRLNQISELIAGKSRIFILVHGFNVNEAESGLAFDLLERRIAMTRKDAVIRVHWDGGTGQGVGIASIWFAAAGNSQVVGMRGLRRILDLAQNQKLYVISHSRGASVVLSAIATPPFSKNFRQSTEALKLTGEQPFLQVTDLTERDNEIHALFLAPAIGFPDFWSAECEGNTCADPPVAIGNSSCPEYRQFSKQLKSIRYTINKGDTVLRKGVFKLRRSFNATDFGFDETVGQRLTACYPILKKPYEVQPAHGHSFYRYAQGDAFSKMLEDAGVPTVGQERR
jgi:hypothetical protein